MKKRMTAVLLSAVLVLSAACTGGGPKPVNSVQTPGKAEYVGTYEEARKKGQVEEYNAWLRERNSKMTSYPVRNENLEALYRGLLQGDWMQSGEDNRLFSPLSFYLSLSALAEMTEGPAQERILKLCGCASLEELQEQTHSVWNRIYEQGDGSAVCVPGTSVWLDESIAYRQSVVDDLTEYDYASVYHGKLEDARMQRAAEEWISDQSEGLLEAGTAFGENTVVGLFSILYYADKWNRVFESSDNFDDIFYGTKGEETVTYMQQDEMSYQYYEGDGYILVRKTLNNNGYMWFALPDEGNSPEAVWKDEMFVSMLSNGMLFHNQAQSAEVNLTLPKLDLTEEVSLAEPMCAMGLEELFLPEAEAFAPLTEDRAFLSDLIQQTRLIVDEQGVRAATLTQAELLGAAEPMIRIDVVLNRPFAFAVTGEANLVYYAGIVNHIR